MKSETAIAQVTLFSQHVGKPGMFCLMPCGDLASSFGVPADCGDLLVYLDVAGVFPWTL